MSPESIQVLIVDDIPQVRQGLATMLKLAARTIKPTIEVIGEAQNGADAIQQALALHPDAVLMDLEMPILNGYQATQSIKAKDPSIFIIILTIHDDQDTRRKAAQAGADAFIEKSAPLEGLIQAIQNIRKVNFDKELL